MGAISPAAEGHVVESIEMTGNNQFQRPHPTAILKSRRYQTENHSNEHQKEQRDQEPLFNPLDQSKQAFQ